MTRRRLILGGLAAASLIATAVVGFILVPRSPITKASVDNVRGLSLAEVELVFRGPGLLEWTSRARSRSFMWSDFDLDFDPAAVAAIRGWEDRDRMATVLFDADGVAIGGVYQHHPTGLLAPLWRWLP